MSEVREKIKTVPPDPLRKANPKIHPAVEALCLRCLRKRQSERFGTPKELSDNIDKVLDLILAEDPSPHKVRVRLTRRISAAQRRRESGPNSPQRRSDVGKVPGKAPGKAPGKVGPKGVPKAPTKGTGKTKIKRTSVNRAVKPTVTTRRNRRLGTASDMTAPTIPRKDSAKTVHIVTGVIAILVLLALVALSLNS